MTVAEGIEFMSNVPSKVHLWYQMEKEVLVNTIHYCKGIQL